MNAMRGDKAREERLAGQVRAGGSGVPEADTRKFEGRRRMSDAAEIEVERLMPDPDQPRKEFDEVELARLADSLREQGQLQPIRVRWDEGRGLYIIIVGERRYRAARIAGLTHLACIISPDNESLSSLRAKQIVENTLRESLKPIEQAQAYKDLMEMANMTQAALADYLHISPAKIAKSLALLGLPEDIKESVESGEIPASAAYHIAKEKDGKKREKLATQARTKGLGVADIEAKTQSRPRQWSYLSGRVKITALRVEPDVSEEEIDAALRAALAARKRKPGAAA